MSITAIRFRVQDALVVLQVQARKTERYSYGGEDMFEWRDAQPTDLLEVARFTSDWNELRIAITEQIRRIDMLWETKQDKQLDGPSPAYDQRSNWGGGVKPV